MKQNINTFIKELLKLKDEPIAIIGLGKMMGVEPPQVTDESKSNFDLIEDYIIEIIKKFDTFDGKKRRTIIQIMQGKYRK